MSTWYFSDDTPLEPPPPKPIPPLPYHYHGRTRRVLSLAFSVPILVCILADAWWNGWAIVGGG